MNKKVGEVFISGALYVSGTDRRIYVYKSSGLAAQITGINEEKINSILKSFVYPNPFNYCTNITLDSSLPDAKSIVIISDVFGKEVWRTELKNNTAILYKQNFEKGVYFYKIVSGNAILSTGKLIAE